MKSKVIKILICTFIVIILISIGFFYWINKDGNDKKEIQFITVNENIVPIEAYDIKLFSNDSDPRMYISDNDIYVVWENYTAIFFTHSSDNGNNWEEVIILFEVNSSTGDYCWFPEVIAAEATVHVVWSGRYQEQDGIYYLKSTNNGHDWGDVILITDTEASGSREPQIAAYESNIYVVFADYRNVGPNIYFSSSRDNGESWADEILLNDKSDWGASPSIVVNKNKVLVAFEEGSTYKNGYIRSTDGGKNWSEVEIFDGLGMDHLLILKNAENDVHMVWLIFYGEHQIYYRKGSDNGQKWENKIFEMKELSVGNKIFDIAVYDENVIIAWEENDLISLKRSSDGGNTWEDNTYTIYIENSTARRPDISIDQDFVHIVAEKNNKVCYLKIELKNLN